MPRTSSRRRLRKCNVKMECKEKSCLIHLGRSWQPINVTWLSLNFKSPQKRAIAYAVYSKKQFSSCKSCIC